ncbi:MAG: DNA-directed RNA polymerase subunit beta, partial [Ornithinimicrobium sp.]
DLEVALERAAAFAHVMAVGLADPAADMTDVPAEQVKRAARIQSMARDLHVCAGLWGRGDLT